LANIPGEKFKANTFPLNLIFSGSWEFLRFFNPYKLTNVDILNYLHFALISKNIKRIATSVKDNSIFQQKNQRLLKQHEFHLF
jgi:hypothetical protein